MPAKYSKAPISELVFGVNFVSNDLLREGVIFEFINLAKQEFSIINTHPTIPDEDVLNEMLNVSVDYSKTGFSVFRLFTPDNKWHLLIQQNFFSFHWKRDDNEGVGNYPGFDNSFSKFMDLFKTLEHLFLHHNLDIKSFINSYYLSYTDRLIFESYKNEGMNIEDILNIRFPSFAFENNLHIINNYFNKYSASCSELNGNSIIGINTPTLPNIGQILIVENKLKGKGDGMSIDQWFDIAHKIQLSFFEAIFSSNILKMWK